MDIKAVNENLDLVFDAVIKAPTLFVLALLICSTFVWKILSWRYSGTIAHLEERIKLKDERVNEYERKLSGASPDQASARIASLEKQVATLNNQQRYLSEYQKQVISEEVRGVDANERTFSIIYPLPSQEAAIFAHDFADAYGRSGWTISPDHMIGSQRVRCTGITLGIPRHHDKAIADSVARGLQRANIIFSRVEIDAYYTVRLFIDMFDSANLEVAKRSDKTASTASDGNGQAASANSSA